MWPAGAGISAGVRQLVLGVLKEAIAGGNGKWYRHKRILLMEGC